jgi:xanthine dehydrogenase small subunit
LNAAAKACDNKAALKLDDVADVPLLKEIQRAATPTLSLEGDIIVQPVVRTRKGNEFVSPATIAEVADYLVKHPSSTLLAGSTEVGLQVNKQYARPDHIVYLGNVAELKQVKDTPKAWHIGAVVSLTEVETLVAKVYPDFAEVLRRFGSPPIRSTATLAGNIANGSPIGDSMPCLMALGASLLLRAMVVFALSMGRSKRFRYAAEHLRQCERLEAEFHIYLLKTGRINVCGLSASTVPHLAKAIHAAVTGAPAAV